MYISYRRFISTMITIYDRWCLRDCNWQEMVHSMIVGLKSMRLCSLIFLNRLFPFTFLKK
jgi:hypothetical protein